MSLQTINIELRQSIIEMLTEAKSGHPGGSLSSVEILSVLWFEVMRGVDNPKNLPENRDRFILSKGHGVPTLYAILAKKGFIDPSELMTLRKTGSRLQGHPDRMRLPIVEASTGSLGQGMSVAQGMALGLKMDHASKSPSEIPRVYCLIGDGESQEGQIWECALSAPKFKLSNLCVVLDANNGQIDGFVSDVMPLEPLMDKFKSFGWETFEIDGHDLDQVRGAFDKAKKFSESGGEKPQMIIARTVKGKGVSFMEHKIEWHGVVPKPDQCKAAVDEIKMGITKGGIK